MFVLLTSQKFKGSTETGVVVEGLAAWGLHKYSSWNPAFGEGSEEEDGGVSAQTH